jgi:hypothetical protein
MGAQTAAQSRAGQVNERCWQYDTACHTRVNIHLLMLMSKCLERTFQTCSLKHWVLNHFITVYV